MLVLLIANLIILPVTISFFNDDGCHDTFALTLVENFTGESSTTPFDTSSPHLD